MVRMPTNTLRNVVALFPMGFNVNRELAAPQNVNTISDRLHDS